MAEAWGRIVKDGRGDALSILEVVGRHDFRMAESGWRLQVHCLCEVGEVYG